jgi:hypothetical protein
VAAQSALGPGALLSNAPLELFERSQSATRKPCSAIHRFGFRHHIKGRCTTRLTLLVLATLLLAPKVARATTAGPASALIQASAGASTAAQGDNEVRELELGKPVERELAGGQRHSYQLMLNAGQYLQATVSSMGIVVVVTLFRADGQQIIEIESRYGREGPMPVFLVAKHSGKYRIEVRAAAKKAAAGRYEIKIEEWRAATPQDSSRIEAQKAFAQGEILRKQGTKESQQAAIEKYEQALPLWRAAGARRAVHAP